jgi:hypothetical protein
MPLNININYITVLFYFVHFYIEINSEKVKLYVSIFNT